MIVKYNHPGVLTLGYTNGFLTLLPGVNEVDASQWDKVKTNPQVVVMMSEGKLELPCGDEIPTQQAVDAAPADTAGIAGFHPKTAQKLVRDTVDRDLLHKWLGSEVRPSVVKALNEQLARVEVKPAQTVGVSIG